MDSVGHSLLDMETYFNDRMAKFEAELQKKSPSQTGGLAEDFHAFKSFVLKTLESFSAQLQNIAREVDTMEMRNRRKMLLLHGIPEQKGEDITQVVAGTIGERLAVDGFVPEDIRRCHRMGRQSSPQKPRPILVKLQTVAVRDKIWFSKVKLKGTGITVSEFLTRARHNTFVAAREKFGVTKCWTREGYVCVLDADDKRHRITSLAELGQIKCIASGKVQAPVKTTAPKVRRAAATTKK